MSNQKFNPAALLLLVLAAVGYLALRDPQPNPTPPVPPGTLAAATRALYESRIAGDNNGSEAAAVAECYRVVAAEIETLVDPLVRSPLKRPQDAIQRVANETATALGVRAHAWQPFFDSLADELQAREAAGQIPRSIYGVGEAFVEIAAGLTVSQSITSLASSGGKHLLCSFDDPESFDPEAAYTAGLSGAQIDEPGQPLEARLAARQGDAEFAALAGDQAVFSAAFPRSWSGAGKGKRAVYWNYALRFDHDPTPLFQIKQITGNCVEASNGDVTFTHLQGVAIFLLREPYAWRAGGSSAFYMFRGKSGQGMNLGVAAAAHQKHGFAVRDVYCGGKYDLRNTLTDQRFGMDNWRSQPRDFLEETGRNPIGRVARFNGGADDALDVLYAGGVLHTGSTATAAKDGDPVSSGASVGAHAQSCIGFDDTDEFRDWYQSRTGKRLTEPVFIFDQTWGETRYVQANWPDHLWGQQTAGMFVLRWSDAKRLILSTCYAYWPDLTGFTPAEIEWRISNARQAASDCDQRTPHYASTM